MFGKSKSEVNLDNIEQHAFSFIPVRSAEERAAEMVERLTSHLREAVVNMQHRVFIEVQGKTIEVLVSVKSREDNG